MVSATSSSSDNSTASVVTPVVGHNDAGASVENATHDAASVPASSAPQASNAATSSKQTSTAKTLPDTGEATRATAVLGGLLAIVMGWFGLAAKRRKSEH